MKIRFSVTFWEDGCDSEVVGAPETPWVASVRGWQGRVPSPRR